MTGSKKCPNCDYLMAHNAKICVDCGWKEPQKPSEIEQLRQKIEAMRDEYNKDAKKFHKISPNASIQSIPAESHHHICAFALGRVLALFDEPFLKKGSKEASP